MFLNNPLQHRFGTTVIPDAIGPDDRDRTGSADSQAIGLGPGDPALARKAQFGKSPLEVSPGGGPFLMLAALCLFRFRAKEDMPGDIAAADQGQRPLSQRNVRCIRQI